MRYQYEGNRIRLLQWLFGLYSQCGLTFPSDRAVAIRGLEKRLGNAFRTRGQFGIFERYRHRCLLWELPHENNTGNKRIAPLEGKIPSWSWMAFSGHVSYLEVPFENVEWSSEVRCVFMVEEKKLPATTTLELRAPVRQLRLLQDVRPGKLGFDYAGEEHDLDALRGAVIGREIGNDPDYYVLLVAPSGTFKGKYERVGVGSVKEGNLWPEIEWAQIV